MEYQIRKIPDFLNYTIDTNGVIRNQYGKNVKSYNKNFISLFKNKSTTTFSIKMLVWKIFKNPNYNKSSRSLHYKNKNLIDINQINNIYYKSEKEQKKFKRLNNYDYHIKGKKELANFYVGNQIVVEIRDKYNITIKRKEIPQELIELKRKKIQLSRIIKKIKNETKFKISTNK